MKGKLRVCSRGHKFYKSSDCPVCPICWSGFYKKKKQSDFPQKLSAPALRALINANITKLSHLSKYTEREVLALHGMGPRAIEQLRSEMKKRAIKFRVESKK